MVPDKSVTLNQFQEWCLETWKRTQVLASMGKHGPILYPTLKLNGEAGELAEKVGKAFRDDGGEFTEDREHALALELGDCLWYIAVLADELGLDLEEVARMNRSKLTSRAKRGEIHGDGDYR